MSVFYGVELPVDVLKEIVSFISDPVTVCRLACSCQSFHNVLTNDDQIWERLYHLRWKRKSFSQAQQQQQPQRLSSPKNKNNSNSTTATTFLQKYQQRHSVDRKAWILLSEMASCLLKPRQDGDNDDEKGENDGDNDNDCSIVPGEEWEHANWTKLRSRTYGNNIEDLLRAVVHDNRTYPALEGVGTLADTPTSTISTADQSLSADGNSTLFPQKSFWNTAQSLAGIALDAIHHHRVMNEWHTLIHSLSLSLSGSPSYNEDMKVLEKGILLLVKSQMDFEAILSFPDGPERILNSTVSQLDDIGRQFQRRLVEADINVREDVNNNMTLQAVTLLNEMLVEEMGFEGNASNYYDVANSMINIVLQTGKGIPITLSVLYKCICHRVGIQVDIIGLPGHVVLGIPSSGKAAVGESEDSDSKFIDVFNGGKILTLEQCRSIAASYGHPWRDGFIRPLTATQVLSRMLNNIMACYGEQVQSNKSAKLALTLEKVRALSMVTQLHYTPHAYMLLEIWPERMPLVLDPDAFMRFAAS